jgi:hypothetical protein
LGLTILASDDAEKKGAYVFLLLVKTPTRATNIISLSKQNKTIKKNIYSLNLAKLMNLNVTVGKKQTTR